MQEREIGFSLSLPEAEGKKGTAGYVLTASLLFAGLGACLWSILGLSGTGAHPLPVLGVGCIYCAVSCGAPGKRWYVYLAAVLIPAVYTLCAGTLIFDGWSAVINQIFSSLEIYLGRIFPRFEIDTNVNQPVCADCFLMLPAILLAVLCGRASKSGGGWVRAAAAVAAAVWCAALYFRAPLPLIGTAALIISAAVISGRKLPGKKDRNTVRGRIPLWLPAVAAFLVLVSAVFALFFGQAEERDADAVRRDAARYVHALRYDPDQKEALPEGNLSEIPDFNGIDDPVLLVETDQTEKLYLRGFVGEVYVGDSWTELPAERRAEYATLFSWLHDGGFYGQNQYAVLTEALGMADGTQNTVKVTNAGACTRYLYSPYEVTGNEKDANRIGDENLTAKGMRGQSEYTLVSAGSSVTDSEIMYQALSAARSRGDSQAIAYLTQENAYREFVYDNYLDLTEEAEAAAERLLEGWNLPEGKISFRDAQTVVDTSLSAYWYQENPQNSFTDGDFLTYFLEESGAGNSVHFATAATLLFRYLGIPARYVEGYQITPEEIASAPEGEAVSVTGRNACAWAEIYRDGVGFVPFEMDLSSLAPPPPEDQNPDDSEDNPPEQEQPDSLFSRLPLVLKIVIPVPLIILICFALLAVRRKIRRNRLQRLLNVPDNGEAAANAVTYLLHVLTYADIVYQNGSLLNLKAEIKDRLGDTAAETYCTVISIQRKALFSGETVSDSERACAVGFFRETADMLKKQAGPGVRFRMKWIDGIC